MDTTDTPATGSATDAREDQAEQIAELGGEPLDGSGFEEDEPNPESEE